MAYHSQIGNVGEHGLVAAEIAVTANVQNKLVTIDTLINSTSLHTDLRVLTKCTETSLVLL